jgi:hypothetical protein
LANALKELARFMRKRVGVRFNPLANPGFTCGKVIDIDGLVDLDHFDDLADPGMKMPLPPIIGPLPLMIPNLAGSRSISLGGSAATAFVATAGIDASVEAAFASASNVSFAFEDVTSLHMDPGPLQAHIRAAIWSDRLAAALDDPDRHIVVQEYWGKVTLNFTKAGGGSADVKTKVSKWGKLGASAKWTFTSAATLQSNEPILFALETSRYNRHAGELVGTS